MSKPRVESSPSARCRPHDLTHIATAVELAIAARLAAGSTDNRNASIESLQTIVPSAISLAFPFPLRYPLHVGVNLSRILSPLLSLSLPLSLVPSTFIAIACSSGGDNSA